MKTRRLSEGLLPPTDYTCHVNANLSTQLPQFHEI